MDLRIYDKVEFHSSFSRLGIARASSALPSAYRKGSFPFVCSAGCGGTVCRPNRSVRTGSPQPPPPGGGLHSRAARKQAHPLGCGPASGWIRSAASGGEGPLSLIVASPSARLRVCLGLESEGPLFLIVAGPSVRAGLPRVWIGPPGPCGPQPPGGGGPQLVSAFASARARPPQAASR